MVGSSSLICSSRRGAFLASVFLVVFLIGSGCAFPLTVDVGGGAATTKIRSSTALSAERRPWNLFQFVQQSARFVNPFQTTKAMEQRVIQRGDVLWKAGRLPNINEFTFGPLDDVVMGGASSSSFDEATGKWKGQVTDANNGGFVGIRSTPFVDWDMSQCQGIELQLTTTSALRLKVVVRDSTEFNGIGWTTSSDIGGGGGRSVKIPFSKQIPSLFAKTVSGQTFSKDQVKALQFTYSKFEYDGALNPKFSLGDFQVQVEEIRAY